MTVIDTGHAGLAGAVGTAENQSIVRLRPMADDSATTVSADWRELLNGTLEGVEIQRFAATGDDLERLVIVVSASGTGFHEVGQGVVAGGVVIAWGVPLTRERITGD